MDANVPLQSREVIEPNPQHSDLTIDDLLRIIGQRLRDLMDEEGRNGNAREL